MKKTYVDKYGRVVIRDLPYSRNTIRNFALSCLYGDERFVLLHIMQGVSLDEIGRRLKGTRDHYNNVRLKGVSRERVVQIRDEAMARMRSRVDRAVGNNLTAIELQINLMRRRAVYWRKVVTGLDWEGKEEKE